MRYYDQNKKHGESRAELFRKTYKAVAACRAHEENDFVKCDQKVILSITKVKLVSSPRFIWGEAFLDT